MKCRTPKFARPSLETLEARCTPAAVLTVGHNLWITGTDAADTVSVSNTTVGTVKSVSVTEQSGTAPAQTTTFAMSALTGGHVFLIASKGNDRFTNLSSLQVVAYGGSGNDYFYSQTASFIYGGTGNNTIDCRIAPGTCVLDGGGGNDMIYGGTGTNFITGGAGTDILVGNPLAGINDIIAGPGTTTIYGGGGVNYLYGGAGKDILIASANSTLNYMVAGTGLDTLVGGGGKNYLYGGASNDILIGGANATLNYLQAGAGNTTLYASDGINYLYGGAGNDILIGGAGINYLYGGGGSDNLYGGSGFNFLDGGTDGSTDHLIGGTGPNQFFQNSYSTGSGIVHRAVITNYHGARDTLFG